MGLFGGVLAGLGGIVGQVIGATSNDKAIKRATQAQIAGIDKAIGEQQRQFDLTRTDFAPFLGLGTSAVAPLGNIMGLNGAEPQDQALLALRESPMFKRLFETGQEGILQSAAATGGVRGGNTQGALYDLGENTFANLIQQQIANLAGVTGIGQGAAGSLGTFGANKANQVSSGLTSIGNSQFNSILGRQNNWNNMSQNISSIIASVMGGGGAPGGGLPGLTR